MEEKVIDYLIILLLNYIRIKKERKEEIEKVILYFNNFYNIFYVNIILKQ